MELGFEPIADVWLAHVRDQGNAWFGVNAAALLERLPPPGRATLELGCGEGRFGRELVAAGHRVTGVELSPTLAALARESFEVVEADAAALPFADGSFDLVVAFMSLMDIDNMAAAVREAVRVLEPGCRFSAAIVHPVLSAGEGEPFTIARSYLAPHRYRGKLITTGHELESWHRPLEAYTRALEDVGLLVESVRELQGVRRPHLPISLHLHAVKPGRLGRMLAERGHTLAGSMPLVDMDDMDGAVQEAAGVLEPGGRFCVAAAHPLAASGTFESDEPDSPFVLREPYFAAHRDLDRCFRALDSAGFALEALREPAHPTDRRWARVPALVHLRLLKR